MYELFCKRARAIVGNKNVSKSELEAVASNVSAAKAEFRSLFDFLGGDAMTVLVSLVVIMVTGFSVALLRTLAQLNVAMREKAMLVKQNVEIQKEL